MFIHFVGRNNLSGIVTNQDGLSISVITILDGIDQTNGIVTDFYGNFTINVPYNGTINVSFIGNQTQTISISGQTNLSISLEEGVSALDEVIITGYGSKVKKSDLAGSIA